MANAIYVIPFTQLVEDVMFEVREAGFADANVEKKFQRRINYVYQNMIPAEFEFWDFLKKRGAFTLGTVLQTGTVSVTANSTTVSYATGGMTTNAYAGYIFQVPATNETYEIASNTANTFTLSQAYIGATNTAATFRVFKTIYSLASDFNLMTTEPGFWYEISGGRQYLDWDDESDWSRNYTTQPSQVIHSIREYTERATDGSFQVEVTPPPTESKFIRYEYYKSLPQLREFTTGTATTTAASTTVTTNSDYSANIAAGMYFRIDSDGTWAKIVSVSGATITLEAAYPVSYSTKAYTVCDAPAIPDYLHMAIFFGGCMLAAQDQGDSSNTSAFAAQYKMLIGKALAKQNKKRYGRKILRFSSQPARRALGYTRGRN